MEQSFFNIGQKIPFFSVKEYLNDQSPIPEDIISPRILTKRGLLVLGGPPKIGKSDFLISWLVYMAAGRSFLGMMPSRPLKIFYMQTEIEYDYMKERLQQLQLDKELLDIAANNLIITPRVQLSLSSEEIDEIKNTVKERFKPDIIYNVDYGSSQEREDKKILNDNQGEKYELFLYDICSHILAYTKGAIYICISSSEFSTLQKAFEEAGGKWSTFIIWAKNHFTLGRSDYQRQYEAMLYGWKSGNKREWHGGRNQSDLWFYDKPIHNSLHPTMKPVELMEKAIVNSSRPGDTVLDPFSGSGSTLIACERTGRICRTIELDSKFVDVTIKRWQIYTGRDAFLASTGKTFAEIQEENS